MLSRSNWRAILALLVLIVITVWSVLLFAGDEGLHVFFFDVGQGDAILIKKGTFQVLIDGGPDETILSHLGRTLPPWDRTIEIVVLSHPHADHLVGLVEVLKRYEVGEIWGTGVIHTSEIYIDFLKEIRNRKVPYQAVSSGFQKKAEDISLVILAPIESLTGQRLANANLGSIVLKASFGRFSILFTGDAEAPTQQELIKKDADLAADVIKVPHQGSRDAALTPFLEAVRPVFAILSVGERNRYGHPHTEALRLYEHLGINLLRTDRDGTVSLATDGQTVWIKTAKTGTMMQVELVE